MSEALRRLSKVLHTSNGHERRSSGEFSPVGSGGHGLSKVLHTSSGHTESSPTGTGSHSASPHRKSLAQVLHLDKESFSGSEYESGSEYDSDGMSKNAQKRMRRKQKHDSKTRLSLESRDESEEWLQKRLEEVRRSETEDMKARYGQLPLMQSQTKVVDHRIDIDTINKDVLGKEVCFRARLHHVRNMGPKLVFLIFRQQISTIQGVLVEDAGRISLSMLHWAEHLRTGNVMLVKGIVQEPTSPVKATSIHLVEVGITSLHVIVRRSEPGKFHVCTTNSN